MTLTTADFPIGSRVRVRPGHEYYAGDVHTVIEVDDDGDLVTRGDNGLNAYWGVDLEYGLEWLELVPRRATLEDLRIGVRVRLAELLPSSTDEWMPLGTELTVTRSASDDGLSTCVLATASGVRTYWGVSRIDGYNVDKLELIDAAAAEAPASEPDSEYTVLPRAEVSEFQKGDLVSFTVRVLHRASTSRSLADTLTVGCKRFNIADLTKFAATVSAPENVELYGVTLLRAEFVATFVDVPVTQDDGGDLMIELGGVTIYFGELIEYATDITIKRKAAAPKYLPGEVWTAKIISTFAFYVTDHNTMHAFVANGTGFESSDWSFDKFESACTEITRIFDPAVSRLI